jgi:hypothetical protein
MRVSIERLFIGRHRRSRVWLPAEFTGHTCGTRFRPQFFGITASEFNDSINIISGATYLSLGSSSKDGRGEQSGEADPSP